MHSISTKFGVDDNSSRFPFTAWTHRHTDLVTDATDHPNDDSTHASVKNEKRLLIHCRASNVAGHALGLILLE